MTQKDIQKAYTFAKTYISDKEADNDLLEDIVQIGIQMAINGEIVLDDEGFVIKID